MYRLEIYTQAQKDLSRLPPQDQKKVVAAIDHLILDPFAGKKLKGKWLGYRVMCAWPFRIIYTIDKKIITITVVGIGHRKDVYKE